MRKRRVKASALVLLATGSLFQLGCLTDWFWNVAINFPGTMLYEWLLDNDAVYDLFEDGNTTA
jgi:hypothetical protein